MNTPLVTIIIPVYNSEKYLRKCADNILKQTYKNLQIIFVDDGSSDGSLGICKSINDERVEVYTKQNGGASSARNHGLQYRRGQYILFVDSDDHLREDAVEILVKEALRTDADCVYYEAHNYTDDPNLKIKHGGLEQKCQYPISSGNSLINALLDNKNYHAVPFLYFAKRELYDRGLCFEEGIMFEDELFSFELLRMCNIVSCLKQVLYYRYVRPNSVMTASGKQLFRFHSITTVYERLYSKLSNNENDSVYLRYISRIAMLWLDYWEQLPKDDKLKVQDTYATIKLQILQNHGFDNKEVAIRARNRYLWLAYIAPGRILKRLLRK